MVKNIFLLFGRLPRTKWYNSPKFLCQYTLAKWPCRDKKSSRLKALMFTMRVPKHLWGETVLTTCYLINRLLNRVLQYLTPMSILIKSYPIFQSLNSLPLKTFGCSTFIHVHYQNRSKLDPQAIKCVFLEYSPS